MSDTNTAIAPAPETAKIITTVTDVVIKIGGKSLPIINILKPAHERKLADGSKKTIEAKNSYRAATPSPADLPFVIGALIAEAGEKGAELAERIFGAYLADVGPRGYVQRPDGSSFWDENLYRKELPNPTPTRRSGTSIEDLREQHSDVLVLRVTLGDALMALNNGENIDYGALSAAVGRPVAEKEAVIVMYSEAKKNQLRLQAAITAKQDSINKATLAREEKKAAKAAEAAKAAPVA